MKLEDIKREYETTQADLRTVDAALNKVSAQIKDYRDDLDQRLRELNARQLEVEQIVGDSRYQRRGGTGLIESAGSAALRALEEDGAFARLQAGTPGSVQVTVETSIRAALTTDGWGTTDDTTIPTMPERRDGYVIPPQGPTTLLDVLPSRPTTRDSVEFVQLTAEGDAEEQITQGAEKAETEISGELKTAHIGTVALHTTVARQTLADQAALQRAIDTLLRQRVRGKAEKLLMLGGTGAEASSRIDGLAEQSVAYLPFVSPYALDHIGELAAHMLMAGYRPNVVVLHPLRWHALQVTKDGEQNYVLSVPTSPAGTALWNLRVALSPHVDINEAFVFDTSYIDVLDRQAVSVMVSIHHNGNFTKNRATILAEMRLGLEVRDQLAVRRIVFGTDQVIAIPT